jgi:hypothetical protein
MSDFHETVTLTDKNNGPNRKVIEVDTTNPIIVRLDGGLKICINDDMIKVLQTETRQANTIPFKDVFTDIKVISDDRRALFQKKNELEGRLKDMSDKNKELSEEIEDLTKGYPQELYIQLTHGRYGNVNMDERGFDGPILGPFKRITKIYNGVIRVEFKNRLSVSFFPPGTIRHLEVEDDMIRFGAALFGEMDVITKGEVNPVMLLDVDEQLKNMSTTP